MALSRLSRNPAIALVLYSFFGLGDEAQALRPKPKSWVGVQELKLSYYNPQTMVFAVYIPIMVS